MAADNVLQDDVAKKIVAIFGDLVTNCGKLRRNAVNWRLFAVWDSYLIFWGGSNSLAPFLSIANQKWGQCPLPPGKQCFWFLLGYHSGRNSKYHFSNADLQ